MYGRTLGHNQISADGWFTKFSYPWCSAGALRAPNSAINEFLKTEEEGEDKVLIKQEEEEEEEEEQDRRILRQ